ncbi:hypothetical protein FV228_16920 [Methylobacterium sp. WL18]|uniref:hypothetical protein n=1 Tax=Methylobacterium sp. WL18 TaxID=2603897 RepID=UPI0011C80D94|nr:hypothetical protein [Methylobacterium sp. WL18]TXN64329.1 hypothetical protein FV228_16920 [Methylobacterium sp. WL18]
MNIEARAFSRFLGLWLNAGAVVRYRSASRSIVRERTNFQHDQALRISKELMPSRADAGFTLRNADRIFK